MFGSSWPAGRFGRLGRRWVSPTTPRRRLGDVDELRRSAAKHRSPLTQCGLIHARREGSGRPSRSHDRFRVPRGCHLQNVLDSLLLPFSRVAISGMDLKPVALAECARGPPSPSGPSRLPWWSQVGRLVLVGPEVPCSTFRWKVLAPGVRPTPLTSTTSVVRRDSINVSCLRGYGLRSDHNLTRELGTGVAFTRRARIYSSGVTFTFAGGKGQCIASYVRSYVHLIGLPPPLGDLHATPSLSTAQVSPALPPRKRLICSLARNES